MSQDSSGHVEVASQELVSLAVIFDFLSGLIRVTLGARETDLETLRGKFAEGRFHRFASDPGLTALFVHKRSTTSSDVYLFDIVTELTGSTSIRATLAILKRTPTLMKNVSLQDQLQIINLPGSGSSGQGYSAYEALHGLIRFAISPYFDAFATDADTNDQGRKIGDSKKGVPDTRKKLAELELSLLHLQQSIEIPNVLLVAHPIIQQAVQYAAKEHTRPTMNSIENAAALEDASVLNAIQATTVIWRQQIKQVTEKDRDPSSGTANQEINFWLNLDQVLADVEKQLKSDSITLTFDVLTAGKRLGVNGAMIMQDTGLRDARDKVRSYSMLMRDFPLDELLSAVSLAKTAEAVDQVFDHVNRRLRAVPYPVARAIPLVEAITKDLEMRVLTLLQVRRLMHLDYDSFSEVMSETQQVFASYDNKIRDFITTARDVLRKRNEKFLVVKVNAAHSKLQERLIYLQRFRQSHQQLFTTISSIINADSSSLAPGQSTNVEIVDLDAVQEIQLAYTTLKDVDVLDISAEGTNLWVSAEQEYDERIAKVETTVISLLRARLDAANTANEMFRVFSVFNSLFVRTRIRGAIQEYQSQLIDGVKNDLSRLQDKFRLNYVNSDAYLVNSLRDIPPVSGHIIWTRQIHHQLDSYMNKVATVLGDAWHLYAEGQKLHAESTSFRQKLEVRPIFDQWLREAQEHEKTIKGRVLLIQRNRANGNQLELTVNFDEKAVNLFKEVRNLLHLGFTIPHLVSSASKMAKLVYPHAMCIIDSNMIMQKVYAQEHALEGIRLLAANYDIDMQSKLKSVASLTWNFFRDESSRSRRAAQLVAEWSTALIMFQTKVDVLATANDKVKTVLALCQSCPYSSLEFEGCLSTLQKLIDQLSLENFVNTDHWVTSLNESLETIFTQRVTDAIQWWLERFSAETESWTRDNKSATGVFKKELQIPFLEHEVVLKNHVIAVEPPLEFARASWHEHLSSIVRVVVYLPKLQASRYDLDVCTEDPLNRHTFEEVAQHIASPMLEAAHSMIQKTLRTIEDYVTKWLQFQSLWDLRPDQVWETLGDNLDQWLQILVEIRKGRTTFDTSGQCKIFAHMSINYENAQGRVTAKYDAWQRDVLLHFAHRLDTQMHDLYSTFCRTRQDLESQALDSSTTASAVNFITTIQGCSRLIDASEVRLQQCRDGQAALVRQRHRLAPDWLPIERLDDEWKSLVDIFTRKNKIVKDQTDALRAKIMAEDKYLHTKIAETVADWAQHKPLGGEIEPQAAMSALQRFDRLFRDYLQELELVNRAKQALDLALTTKIDLDVTMEEMQDLISVWSAVSSIWTELEALKETIWSGVVPRKVRTSLDSLMTTAKTMPSRMRQYAAFDHIQNVLRAYSKAMITLQDLKSDALKERHWNKIFKHFRSQQRLYMPTLTLGAVWNLDLLAHAQYFRHVIADAQGEMTLEQFLGEVRDRWTDMTLDLVNYQNKCRVIKGWDDLFTKCAEDLNAINAMKNSPYYKTFEDEALSWEDKLTRVHLLLDVWVDVQRQWIYLEGIFADNADIRHLLPMESSRFANLNSDFLAVMKKVSHTPRILVVLSLPGVQKSMERLAEVLQIVQRALGEYLEKERTQFPRFYFVGDEDLLELIGNSKDMERVQRHLRKMFSGIATLILNEGRSAIIGFCSRELETVALIEEVSLTKFNKAILWLTALEASMKDTLLKLTARALKDVQGLFDAETDELPRLQTLLQTFPAQVLVLAFQCTLTSGTEASLTSGSSHFSSLNAHITMVLRNLVTLVLSDLEVIQRLKCEALIATVVHHRELVERLMHEEVIDGKDFRWLYHMRFYPEYKSGTLQQISVVVANAAFSYGFEYLGVPDRLVQTPLTDRCFLTLTQALNQKLGGSPFGPAGTGKTETVKSLGLHLGRFVLVFNCDDSFDFQSIGRILLGLSQVGAWGCFDEFNRLEERMLSAVSQQIQAIQLGLHSFKNTKQVSVDLIGRRVRLHEDTGIFITMNPGYAGRSHLPDNLKKLFRSVAMTKPDKVLIAQITFYAQGFQHAHLLASRVVPVFDLCEQRLSTQPHYDFGLRALKSVLLTCGNLKRHVVQMRTVPHQVDESWEAAIVLRSMRESVMPKLVGEDPVIFGQILEQILPGVQYVPTDFSDLQMALNKIASDQGLVMTETWMTKILQLHQTISAYQGVMMVGEAGAGKSLTWKTLSSALQQVDGIEPQPYVIDAKTMTKEALYGKLDFTTREWTDGLLTSIIRRITDNFRAEDTKRHWIVFDGDVDPEWVENMNSMLDDNKLLTLPNGERFNLPSNVKILFEVDSLRHATLATISRCGMVYFDKTNTSPEFVLTRYLHNLVNSALPLLDGSTQSGSRIVSPMQQQVAKILRPIFSSSGLVLKALELTTGLEHIMEYTAARGMGTLMSLMNHNCRLLVDYSIQMTDFPLSADQVESFIRKKLLLSLIWSFAGDCSSETRSKYISDISQLATSDRPDCPPNVTVLDFDVELPNTHWSPWSDKVPIIEVEPEAITQTDLVIPTTETVRQEALLYSLISEHQPVILCGPPGGGKTMTLFSAIRKLPNLEVVGLNFSSATTSELVLKTLEQYCEYRKTVSGTILCPIQPERGLVLFFDEINLPLPDRYGTQQVITFLRQLIEFNGYWRPTDQAWVSLERIQFVGACNPPSDNGRTAFATRFSRHVSIINIDYPGESSLKQIYGVFVRTSLKSVPNLRGYAEALTGAMVDLYLRSRARFNSSQQPHYIYSPREMTRWIRGISGAIRSVEALTLEGLVRIWAHEATRLFQDRLVMADERQWTSDTIKEVALNHFLNIDAAAALDGPLLYSDWFTRSYAPVNQDEMRQYIRARLKTFCEEEVDTPLVPYDDLIGHVLQIDRVFKQPQGHLILIGVSGSGKTTLSRFVAWMNGLKTFQIKVHRKYSAADFDEDLRTVLRRCGINGEKVCFILDESNVLDSGFLERMNTLLANAEIPGLFEGDEYVALLNACKDGSRREGLMLDTPQELYQWYRSQIVRNLHVVFTLNPSDDLATKATTSPALFNRCVLNWFGNWSASTLNQVCLELIQAQDLDHASLESPEDFSTSENLKHTISLTFVKLHEIVTEYNSRMRLSRQPSAYVTPRNFLEMIHQFLRIYQGQKLEKEDQQRHINLGLEKLLSTVEQVSNLRSKLATKREQLAQKTIEANMKLQSMVGHQQEAEQKKLISLEIQESIATQEKEIQQRRAIVIGDLAQAEPAVVEAQNSVSNIKKQQLTEVRSMINPPEAVKLAMESVCTLLGHRVEGWKSVQSIIRRDDFIASIVHFDSESQMTPELRDIMEREYMNKANYQYEAVNRASKACGPLVQWVQAQVIYSEILDKVGPLRAEVEDLEREAVLNRRKADTIIEMIQELEDSISQYKVEYADLISDTQALKAEMTHVEGRVARSINLLKSLSSEETRWRASSEAFSSQMRTLAGDAMLSAALLAYSGYFDQSSRHMIAKYWRQELGANSIAFTQNVPIVNLFTTSEERALWIFDMLPNDELCFENAAMLQKSLRYPLIIDPSDRAAKFLENKHRSRKLVRTSFLDDTFQKHLETALRFGNSILIDDADHFDSIINQILNKEYQKTGGRTLITLGRQQIDVSPTFNLYLSTRNSLAQFGPDICSRVTFVNFTITKSSLMSQTLNAILVSERPDIEERRDTVVKMQGEFRLRLLRLEKDLLEALSNSRGSVLENDDVLETLERLKMEASDITLKAEEANGVILELEVITETFRRYGSACSKILSLLDCLPSLNHYYRFSLRYLEDISTSVLAQAKHNLTIRDQNERVDWMVKALYAATLQKTREAILHKDHMTFTLLLAVAMTSTSSSESDLLSLLELSAPISTWQPGMPTMPQALRWSSDNSLLSIGRTLELLENQPELWTQLFSTDDPEKILAQVTHNSDMNESSTDKLMFLKAFRPDKLLSAVDLYVSHLFPQGMSAQRDYSLRSIILEETTADVPVMLSSVSGFDAAYRIDTLVQELGLRCISVAMGAREGIALAEDAIASAAISGSWVLLKNVHLATSWLGQLEKRMLTLKPKSNFRLLLTLEMIPEVPSNIISTSRVLCFEAPTGMRASMKESLKSIPQRTAQKPPVERSRIFFLLSWLHATIQERLRYPGIGWSQAYDFNDSDFESARRVASAWIDSAASGRDNISPVKLPWRAIRTILSESVYGGRLDDPIDQSTLDTLVDSILTPKSYDIDHLLVDDETGKLRAPEALNMQQFLDWVESLPEHEPPTWLGLEGDAQQQMLQNECDRVLKDVAKLHDLIVSSSEL